jgi:hypothetical protein
MLSCSRKLAIWGNTKQNTHLTSNSTLVPTVAIQRPSGEYSLTFVYGIVSEKSMVEPACLPLGKRAVYCFECRRMVSMSIVSYRIVSYRIVSPGCGLQKHEQLPASSLIEDGFDQRLPYHSTGITWVLRY